MRITVPVGVRNAVAGFAKWATPAGRPRPTLVAGLVVAGLVLRVWHYFANHTIWYDESVLLWNILDKSYLGLLGPLEYAVAAPPVFTFLLKTIAVACGDAPEVWRLVPFACSCGTLVLTPPLARRALPAAVVPVAVALVAFSDSHVWLGCTIKPYAGDCLVATGLMLFFVRTTEWDVSRRVRWLAAAAPGLICFSYAAVFVFGGLLAALLPAAWRANRRGAWAVAAGVVGVTVVALYAGPIRAQRVPGLVLEWEREFLNWRNPVGVPAWALEHTATVFQYNFLPSGFVLAVLAPIGAVAAWRAGKRELVIAVTVPFALAMLASAVKSYPYGFNRLMHFAAPGALVLGMLGLATGLDRIHRRPRVKAGVVGVLVAAVLGPTLFHLVRPWDRPDSSGVAKYVRGHREPGDTVASDEPGYEYFFRGELRPLPVAATSTPPGGRVWVVMDHYTPAARAAYVAEKLAPAGLEPVAGVEFKQASVFLWVNPPAKNR